MIFETPLIAGHLIRRYKRFLADIELNNGQIITVSVPNTGSIFGLTDAGSPVFLSYSSDPKRKYAHRLEMVFADKTWVGVNTALPNRLALEDLKHNLIPSIGYYQTTLREQRYGEKSRIDFLLKDQKRSDCYMEVKNVHFIRNKGLAEFPDTVTQRGARHLDELIKVVQSGKRGIMLYIIQRNDCSAFSICRDLDPVYGQNFDLALKASVEAYAIKCHVSRYGIVPTTQIEIENS